MSELQMKAMAVRSAVFQALLNAQSSPNRESYWRAQAELLDTKFKNEHGRHYSFFTEQDESK